jgi:hypothetical protein
MNNRIPTQMQLFTASTEKGSGEWSTFDAVREDIAGSFRVLTPRREEEPRYSNVVRIRRFRQPHQLFLKGAH